MLRARFCVGVRGSLDWIAVIHAACILCAFLVIFYGGEWWSEWVYTVWVALATLWLCWPIILVLRSDRSWMRFSLAIFVSLLLLAPCVRVYTWWAPDVFGLVPKPRMPTPDQPNVVKTQDLGSGFRRVFLEEFITGGFESIYHGEYLYFRDHQLGDFVSSSVAPSQRLAAFVRDDLESPIRDDHFGFHVFVFRTSDQKSLQLTQELRYDWAGFEWDETGGYLVLLHRHDPPERLALPQA
jgi:hypothetical protein